MRTRDHSVQEVALGAGSRDDRTRLSDELGASRAHELLNLAARSALVSRIVKKGQVSIARKR